MTERRDRLVEAFLDDLGEAPVPDGLARRVARQAREERQARPKPLAAWLGLGAAIAVASVASLAFLTAGPKPAPSVPGIMPPESTGTSAAAPSSPSARATPSPSNLIASLPPTPSTTPLPKLTYRLLLTGGATPALPVQVVDFSGSVTDARAVAPPASSASSSDPAVTRGERANQAIVAWTGFACDQYAEIGLDPAGTSIRIQTHKPAGGCDAVGLDRAVELTFSQPVDPARLQATYEPGALLLDWLDPWALWFSGPAHGYVAGGGGSLTVSGPAVMLEIGADGKTVDSTVIGWGGVTSMGVVIGPDVVERPVVGITCETEVAAPDPLCVPGLFRRDASRWVRVLKTVPVGLATRDNQIVAWSAGPMPADGTAPFPPRTIQLSHDAGAHWTTVANPCDLAPMGMTGAAFDRDGRLVVACEGGGATGSSRKQLRVAIDGAATAWRTMPPLPDQGTGMRLDLTADGHGYAWGARSPLLSTADGGTSWAPEPGGPDSETQEILDASAFAGGGGAVLVLNPSTQTPGIEISTGGSRRFVVSWPH